MIELGEQQQAFMAAPEKAVLDLVYLEPGGYPRDYLDELRLENLDRLDWGVFERLVNLLGKPKLTRAVTEIRQLASQEREFESSWGVRDDPLNRGIERVIAAGGPKVCEGKQVRFLYCPFLISIASG